MDEIINWLQDRPYYWRQIKTHQLMDGREGSYAALDIDYLLGEATAEPGGLSRTDTTVDSGDGQQEATEDEVETATSALTTVEDIDGGNNTTPIKRKTGSEKADGNENEETVEQQLETFAEVKEQQNHDDEGDCTTCSSPIYQHNLRRESVRTLRKERPNFDGKWTNANSLAICQDCGRILDTHEVKNAI